MAGVGRNTTRAESDKRVEHALALLSKGHSSMRIVSTMMQDYGVSRSAAYTYMRLATALLRKHYEMERPDFLAQQVSAMEEIAHVAMECKQLSAAVGARAAIARMVGIDAPK